MWFHVTGRYSTERYRLWHGEDFAAADVASWIDLELGCIGNRCGWCQCAGVWLSTICLMAPMRDAGLQALDMKACGAVHRCGFQNENDRVIQEAAYFWFLEETVGSQAQKGRHSSL